MFRKWSTSFCVYNILIATHLQPEYTTNTHKTRGEHSARRRKPIHRARIFTLLNMHIRFLVHVCPHYQIRIFIPPHTYVRFSFCGCIHICGHDKSAPTAANGLPKCCKQPAYNATFTHETPNEHSVRRRGPIHRARILTLSNIHIHFNKYAFSHYQMCVSLHHFVVVCGYAGTINRPLQLLTGCQ